MKPGIAFHKDAFNMEAMTMAIPPKRTKWRSLKEALRLTCQAFTIWPLKSRYGFRDWRMALDQLDTALIVASGVWRHPWR